jgi:hypothetical protein
VGLEAEVVEEALHFRDGVGVANASGGGDAGVEAGDGLVVVALFGECLGRHLVGGDVIGVVLDAEIEGFEGSVGVVLAEILHRDAITGEGVGGVEGEDFVEGGDLVHLLILVAAESTGLTPICTDDTDLKDR